MAKREYPGGARWELRSDLGTMPYETRQQAHRMAQILMAIGRRKAHVWCIVPSRRAEVARLRAEVESLAAQNRRLYERAEKS